jgi:YVTN family beta-propeller protein
VTDSGSGTVTPISTATNAAFKAIKVGICPAGIAITPNGKTAYVTSNAGVTPISTATDKPGKLIKIPGGASLIVIGKTP